MMFELKMIPAFHQNYIFDHDFFINEKTRVTRWNWSHFSIIYKSDSRIGLQLIGGCPVIFSKDKAVILRESHTQEIKFISADLRQLKDLKENILVARESRDSYWEIILYYEEGRIKSINFEADLNFVKLLDNDRLFLISDGEVITIDVDSQEQHWRASLQDIFNTDDHILIKGNIFFKNDDVYISAETDAQEIGTICIDINTGEVKELYPILRGWLIEHGDTEIITTSGIIGSNQYLNRLNVKTGDFNQINLSEIIPSNWSIEHNKSTAMNSVLYFAARENLTLPSNLGLIDLDKLNLKYTKELLVNEEKPAIDENRYSIMRIHASEQKIGIYTAEKTLHILNQKESHLTS